MRALAVVLLAPFLLLETVVRLVVLCVLVCSIIGGIFLAQCRDFTWLIHPRTYDIMVLLAK